MRCGSRSLSLVSLGFGLVATGALSLAVATDYWLFTVEPVVAEATLNMTDASLDGLDVGIEDSTGEDDENELDSAAEAGKDDGTKERHFHHQQQQPPPPPSHQQQQQQQQQQQPHPQRSEALLQNASSVVVQPPEAEVMIKVHSGLWRMCIVNEEPGAIRKASPAILGSLLLLLTALTLSIVGTTKNDFKIIVSAIIYIFSALSLGMGVILYISSVNDEVAHRKKQPDSGSDRSSFSYEYGWAFFFGGATFVCAMGAAVSNISLYLRRYSHFDDTLFIVSAAANIGGATSSASADNNELDGAGYNHHVRRADGNGSRSGADVQLQQHPQRNFYEYSGGGASVVPTRWPTYETRRSFDSCRSIHATPAYGLTIPL